MIYFHIPFCKRACHYCNFHFSTSLRHRGVMTAALIRELELRRGEWDGSVMPSLYLGGGTPSLLNIGELNAIFDAAYRLFDIAPDAEITLEANPDDLESDYIRDLKRHTPVNRLSIGVQSFDDRDLRWMNRAHVADQSRRCIELALREGFDDLTIDLIYGAPVTDDETWAENMRIAFDYPIMHLSCYSLTVESGTALGVRVKRGQEPPVDEIKAARHLEMLLEASESAGFEQYEISNYARQGRYARHNSRYWMGFPYLGIGPSAHSFDGKSLRKWNVSNNAHYLADIQSGNISPESELLTPVQRYNEYVMTMIRTRWGCDTARLDEMGAAYRRHFERQAKPYLEKGLMQQTSGVYSLTRAGKFLTDAITIDLFASK